jgi:adenosylhomocysteinase
MSASSGRISAYFSHLVSHIGPDRGVYCLAIAHMVPNTLFFGPALDQLMTLSGILAKPKSTSRPEHKLLSKQYNMPPLSREWAADADAVVATLYQLGLSGKRLILIDIGGYYATSIDKIREKFDGELLGVMEGTENGVMKYEENLDYSTPIITVARSPLKLPEDHLVASSVVFTIEAVLRDQAEILQTRTAAVIGYGRVGSSVAEILRNRGINTVVYDHDPIKLAEAAARGFQSYTSRFDALNSASLVVCATGNVALDLKGFGMLPSGCVVASVTSADDELDLDCLGAGYVRSNPEGNLTRFDENRPGGRHFFLIADGNAANFIHGAVIGPAIQLIEGEKLMALKALINKEVKPAKTGLAELSSDARREVAEVWIEHFL